MAVSELKQLHPYLYRRVWLKGLLFSALGISSILAPKLDAILHAERNNAQGINPLYTGIIFLLLGLGVWFGIYYKKDTYKTIARKFLYGCFIYAMFWEFVLIGLIFTQSISTASIFILWSYLCYNLQLVARDSGWAGAELVREIQENGDVDTT